MGVDALELVMSIERRFGVTIADTDYSRVRTVADLAALVIKNLPQTRAPCPSARSFFEFRKLLMRHWGFERRQIRPTTRLDPLLADRRKSIWRRLRNSEPRLPRLAVVRRVDRVLLMAGAVAFFGSIGLFAAGVYQWGIGLGLLLLIGFFGCSIGLIIMVTRWFETLVPNGFETVGDIARYLAPINVSAENGGERLIAQQRVLDEVRLITAEQLGLPIDKVQPSSSFAKDLKMT